MKYRKKPVVVEAIQFTGTNYEKSKSLLVKIPYVRL